jgi:murein L,D-transpeptidase YcbB/YkuD
MRGLCLERCLTATALALVLTLSPAFAEDAQEAAQALEALVPMPDAADLPPPSVSDLESPATPAIASKPAVQRRGPGARLAPAAVRAVEPATTAAAPASGSAARAAAPVAAPDPATTAAVPAAAPEVAPAATGVDSKPAVAVELSADQPIAGKLRELVTGRLERLFERKKERAAVETFYAGRNFAPLWLEGSAASDRAKSAIARLRQADADGLDPADYRIPDLAAATTPEALADAELKLTAVVLTYARHAQIGRVHFSRVSGDIAYSLVAPEPAEVLARMAEAKDAGQALGAYNPPHEGYKALRAKLAEARTRKGEVPPARIGDGPLLKIGMQDPRVPLIRERLGVAAEGGATVYDKTLSEAVKKFQRQHELSPTGSLNGATVAALDGPRRDRDADIIIANMERWRWLPRDLGKSYVMVNIPDYTLKVVSNGATVWHTKVVVGKPTLPTPLISETMKYITVNPTWNVPPSIIEKEYLPALQQDPMAMERIGLKVEQNPDGTLRIYQPPGDRNALGRIRFNFPNKFLVYQHDTPDKNLFAQDKRAFSHGCMRVQDPLKYGEVLLSIASPKEGYTQERLRRMFGSEERDISLPAPIPVHITYQTAFVDEAGKLHIRDDVYGRDGRMLTVMRGEERRVADIAVDRRDPQTTPRPQAQRYPVRPEPFYRGPYGGGPSFFERLFR